MIKGLSTFEIEAQRGLLEKNQTNKGTDNQFNDRFNQVLSALDHSHQRAIHCAREMKDITLAHSSTLSLVQF